MIIIFMTVKKSIKKDFSIIHKFKWTNIKSSLIINKFIVMTFYEIKNKSGTWGRLRKGLQIPMDGLTDWQTDGGPILKLIYFTK